MEINKRPASSRVFSKIENKLEVKSDLENLKSQMEKVKFQLDQPRKQEIKKLKLIISDLQTEKSSLA